GVGVFVAGVSTRRRGCDHLAIPADFPLEAQAPVVADVAADDPAAFQADFRTRTALKLLFHGAVSGGFGTFLPRVYPPRLPAATGSTMCRRASASGFFSFCPCIGVRIMLLNQILSIPAVPQTSVYERRLTDESSPRSAVPPHKLNS